MADFVSNVQYFGEGSNIPHIVTLRPILSGRGIGDLDSIFIRLAPRIVRAVIDAVGNYHPTWTIERSMREIEGRLVATNEMDGNSVGFTASFSILEDITPDSLAEIFMQIQQSNADILITDIEWSFLINPTSIAVGGSPKVKPPFWAPAVKFRNTWMGWNVNCAAYALNYLMYCNERRYDKNLNRSIEDAKMLQFEMGWGEFTSIREIQDFVDIYDEYRVIIVHPTTLRTPDDFIFTGKKYTFEFNENTRICPEKTFYLVYDAAQKHYAATKSPASLINAFKKYPGYAWCHGCCIGYLMKTGHDCPDKPPKAKKAKKIYPCTKCGVLPVSDKKHVCPLITCRMCSGIYKKETGYDHRCIVFKEPRSEEKNTFCTDKDKADGSFPALWVYDFESRIDIEETNRELIVDFKTEGVYYKDEDVCVYEKKIQKHEVNFVAFKNVFTDEEHCYYGDGALEQFIVFMIQHNNGKNICIAHNAAGYDTRLLFSKLKAMNQKVSMTPIMRGGKFMQLKVNTYLIFRDSLLHVKGSLKSLAKDFCDGLLEKGIFYFYY